MQSSKRLPDFEHPPAVETLLGLQFAPLKKWKTPYFGLFWQDIKAEYPNVEVHPPLPSEPGFQLRLDQARASFQLSGEIPVRWWYFHRSGKRLIQIQSDSFIQNWRKRGIHDPYLHYDQLRPSFAEAWKRFIKFLRLHSVEAPRIQFCEVTYVNHIDKGSGWNDLSDLDSVLTSWSGQTTEGFLPTPQWVTFTSQFPIGSTGRLQVSLQPGIRESDSRQTLQLVLSAQCRPTSPHLPELLKSFDMAREWVVRGFVDLTTTKMHAIWGRKERKR